MERIKQAIENAKKSDTEEIAQDRIKNKKLDSTRKEIGTFKAVAAVVTIFLGAGAWLRLDCLNQQELLESAQICDGIEQARAEGKKRVLVEEKFEKLILANFAYCNAAAEKSKNDYVKLVQDAIRVENAIRIKNAKALSRRRGKEIYVKPEKFYIPEAALIQATAMLHTAQAECQQIYDAQMNEHK